MMSNSERSFGSRITRGTFSRKSFFFWGGEGGGGRIVLSLKYCWQLKEYLYNYSFLLSFYNFKGGRAN